MKKLLLLILVATVTTSSIGQFSYKPPKVDSDTLRSYNVRNNHPNNSFTAGEELKYTIHYGWIDAGEAVLKVNHSDYNFNGRSAYHIVGTGKSLGSFDWFFKVRDRYETYMDVNGMFPHRFIRNCDEGGYKINQDYEFMQDKRAVRTHEDEEFRTPRNIQDMLSAFYYARTLDYNNAKKGDIFTIETMVDGEIYRLQLKYKGKDTIKMREGKFKCMKFVPVLQEGRIFKSEEDMTVWISDDENKIPVMVKTEILFGSIKMELTEWNGLSHPIAKVN